MWRRHFWWLALLAGCGDAAVALPTRRPPEGPGVGGGGGNGGTGGGSGGSGGEGLTECAPPPADLPEVTITEDGQFRRLKKFPMEGFKSRTISVYLPVGYDGTQRYPVVYFTDGQWVFNGGYEADAVMEALAEAGTVAPHIVVAVNNSSDRVRELTPDVDATDPRASGDGDAFAGQIVDRVKPFVDAHFSTRCGRAHTTIAGFSLGGLMCLHMLMRDPDVFGRGACMSPSFWWNDKSILDRFQAFDGALPLRLWIDVGTEEVSTPTMLEADPDAGYHDHSRAIRAGSEIAVDKGMTLGEDLGYYEMIEGMHTQFDIGKRLASVLAGTLSDATLADPAPTGHAFHVWPGQILSGASHPYAGESTVSFELRYDPPFVLTWPNSLLALSSTDPGVATIDQAGMIHAVAPGITSIEASFMDLDGSGEIEVVAAE